MNVSKNGADAAALAENLVLNPASFYQLHEVELRKLWALKLLDASAYILFIVRVHGAAGWKWSFKIKDFCSSWNVGRRTFFRAVSELRTLGLLHWESDDAITVWYGTDIASSPPVEETVPLMAPIPLGIGNYRVTTMSPTVTTMSPTVTTMSPTVPTMSPSTPETVTQSQSRNAPDSFQINFKSSSDLIGEEDFKFQEKKAEEIECKQSLALSDPEEEVDQGGEFECFSATLPDPEEELVAPRAPDLKPDAVSLNETSHSHPASMLDKPKLSIEAIDLGKVNQPPLKSLNRDEEIDKDLLLWVMEVKLPTMQLKEQPINVEAYAKGMLRRDGEKLQAEFADVVAEQKFIKKAAELTEQVEARVREWQNARHAKLTIFHDLDGMPCVLLDGITIGAVDFLAKAVEPAPMVATIPFSPENRVARPARMSRLKISSKINSNPGFEFLEQCWEDFFLRPQVSLILAKHPDWAVVREGKLLAIT